MMAYLLSWNAESFIFNLHYVLTRTKQEFFVFVYNLNSEVWSEMWKAVLISSVYTSGIVGHQPFVNLRSTV